MKPEQRTVAIGASSGITGMALSVWILSHAIASPAGIDGLDAHLAYALRVNVVALLPLFIMIITVANSRFLSDAIDPTLGAENLAQQINGRVVDNTLQQNFVFALTSLALSTLIDTANLQVLWACAIVFVLARFVFWIGYRLHPLLRAPGMAATAYLNLGMILYVLYAAFFRE